MPYTPSRPPPFKSVEEASLYFADQLQLISQEFAALQDAYQFRPLSVEPTRPRDGMLVFADGVHWNPGEGGGIYERISGAWHKPSTGGGVSGSTGTGSGGRLDYVSPSQIAFSPFNNDKVSVAGVIHSIPLSGVRGGAIGVYVNGVAGQNLAGDTTYLIAVFNNNGTLTFDYLTTLSHEISIAADNVGTHIPGGDNTRTVVGMIRTSTSVQFTPHLVISWFNPRVRTVKGPTTSGETTTNIDWERKAGPLGFLVWADSAIMGIMNGQGYISVPPAYGALALLMNGTSDDLALTVVYHTLADAFNIIGTSTSFPEGYNYLDFAMASSVVTNLVTTFNARWYVNFWG